MSTFPDAIQVFKDLDKDGNNWLDFEELRNGLRAAKLPTGDQDVQSVLAQFDRDGDGKISSAEFQAICDLRYKSLRDVYDGVDLNRDGRLNSSELREAVREAGFKISDDELRALFCNLDSNRDGVVSFEEFCNGMLFLPNCNPRAVFETWQHSVVVDGAESHCLTPKDAVAPSSSKASKYYKSCSNLLAGALAGAASRSATAPIDRLKTIIQAQPPGATQKPLLTSFIEIYHEGGLKAYFRGNGVNVIKVAPETAFKFMFFDEFKKAVAKDPGNVTTLERFIAGGLAGTSAQTAIYPLEVVKTRMAVCKPGTYNGMMHCCLSVWQEQGVRGLYKGLMPSNMGILPYAGIDLMTNSLLKDFLVDKYEKLGREPGVVELLGCGMLSSSLAMTVTYPLNLVRTRLQASGVPGSAQYTGLLDVITQTMKRDGAKGFFRGIAPNSLKVLPASSISYAVFDYVQAVLKSK